MSSTNLPWSPAEVAARIEIAVCDWPGNCNWVAQKALTAGLFRGRLALGRADFAPDAAYHAWIETEDGLVIDFTRWVYEGLDPYIYCGEKVGYEEVRPATPRWRSRLGRSGRLD